MTRANKILICSLISCAFAQGPKMAWVEYGYPSDGFAITAPQFLQPHADPKIPQTNVYTVFLPIGNPEGIKGSVTLAPMTLRVINQHRDCAATLGQLRDAALTGKSADPKSVRDLVLNGHSGLEYQWTVNSETVALDRYYCGEGRMYAFSTHWARSGSMPAEVRRVMDSFRLLTPRTGTSSSAHQD